MPKTMKAAVCRTLKTPLAIETVPVPDPGPGDILIKVEACGVCHSDLHAVDGDWDPLPNLPLIPGHEVAGTVAALGAGVSDFKVGDRVGVPWMFWSCGSCEFCTAGMETICLKTEATGYSKPGGYAEYMVAPAAFCGRIPDGVDMVEIAPILCAGVTTYRGLKRTGARPGQWVAVLGIGGLGHIAVQYARAMGFRVAAIDIDDQKLALGRSLGAELTVNGKTDDPVAVIQKELGGVKGALVTAVAPQAFVQAIGVLKPAGMAVYIGLPGGDKDLIRVAISAIVNGERGVTGSNVGTRLDLNEAIDFAARGLVKSKVETAKLEDVNAVFDRMRAGKINGRVVLRIS
ncbi:MAG: zinc-dependent alcohol dehydrogenase [Hyphomicrobiales bacterium]